MLAWTRSLRLKIVLPVLITTVGAIVLFASFTIREVYRSIESRQRTLLLTGARTLSRDSGVYLALFGRDPDRARASVEDLLDEESSILRVELHRGCEEGRGGCTFFGEGRVGPGRLPTCAELPGDGTSLWERDGAVGYTVVAPVRLDETVERSWTEPGKPPMPVEGEDGKILVWASRAPVLDALADYTEAILPTGLLLALASILVTWFATSRVLRHLGALSRATEEIGQGQGEVEIEVEGEDEIGVLAQNFRAMATKLEESRRKNEEQNRDLEHVVANRTRELEKALEELRSLDRAKDSFLSSVSHELRTPLTSIRSFSEILLDYGDEEDPELRHEFLTIIRKESERLTRLVNDVLDLAKIEAGKIEWKVQRFDFRELVLDSLKSLTGLQREKTVLFSMDLPAAPVFYEGDRDRLHQVVTNLVTNAWKFSPEGESVAVSLVVDPVGLEFVVADRGPGIPGTRQKDEVFEKFRQRGDTLTEKPQGTGLGLPISKEIISMHGGLIFCEDNEPQGARFRVLLPASDRTIIRPIDEAVAGGVIDPAARTAASAEACARAR